jgi:hypothetical protein
MVTVLAMPVVFALVGVALIAAAAFGPRKGELHAAVSFAPPVAPPPLARWARPRGWYPPRPAIPEPTPSASDPKPARWAERIDPHAADCSAATRVAIVDALAALRTDWAIAMLHEALADDHEPAVRDAVLRALAG